MCYLRRNIDRYLKSEKLCSVNYAKFDNDKFLMVLYVTRS